MKEAEILQVLESAQLFEGLGKAPLREVAGVIVPKQYPENTTLFLQDAQAHGFFVLVRGSITVYRTGMDGRQQILHVFETMGDVCGEAPVFEGGRYPATADVAAQTALLYLPRDAFLRLARRHPEILMQMLAILSKRLRRFVNLIDDLSLKDVGSRLAKYLLEEVAHASGHDILLRMPKNVLAARLGTIAETVSRSLRKLQAQGLIAVEGRRIRVLDADGLSAIAEGEIAL